jgi:hypothetical protein
LLLLVVEKDAKLPKGVVSPPKGVVYQPKEVAEEKVLVVIKNKHLTI